MNKAFHNLVTETQQKLSQAEHCRGECRADSPEAATLEHVINALQSLLSLLRSIAALIPGDR